MVGAPGFEPGTSCAQGKRATRLRHAPTFSLSGRDKALSNGCRPVALEVALAGCESESVTSGDSTLEALDYHLVCQAFPPHPCVQRTAACSAAALFARHTLASFHNCPEASTGRNDSRYFANTLIRCPARKQAGCAFQSEQSPGPD